MTVRHIIRHQTCRKRVLSFCLVRVAWSLFFPPQTTLQWFGKRAGQFHYDVILTERANFDGTGKTILLCRLEEKKSHPGQPKCLVCGMGHVGLARGAWRRHERASDRSISSFQGLTRMSSTGSTQGSKSNAPTVRPNCPRSSSAISSLMQIWGMFMFVSRLNQNSRHSKAYEQMAFQVAPPQLWNSLPNSLKENLVCP